MNESLSKAYYLKEQLRQVWSQPMKAMGEEVLDDWIRQAEQSKITQLQKMAVTMRNYKKASLYGTTAIYQQEKLKASTTRLR
nr:transposase [Prevotella scopos]